MSNTWFYKVLIPPRPALDAVVVADLAARNGYALFNPETGKLNLMRAGEDVTTLSAGDLTALTPELAAPGALITLWDQDSDLDMIFDITGVGAVAHQQHLPLPDRPHLGSVSIALRAFNFRSTESGRTDLARRVAALFRDLCTTFGAVYGYALDEDATEHFYKRMRPHAHAQARQRPEIIFWLNYFSTAYAEAIDLHALEHLGAMLEQWPSGVAAQFSEYPWQTDISALLELNHRWTATD